MDWSWLTGAGSTEWLRLDLVERLLLAAALGGLIGLEREVHGKPAGFRTNLLICVGSALLTDLSVVIAMTADPATTNADPARIAAQIVSGIGFLGAGTIVQSRGSVVGLTTAATLWVVAAIGIAAGAGAYVEAIGTTILVIVALILLGRFEYRFFQEAHESILRVTMDVDGGAFERVREALTDVDAELESLEVSRGEAEYVASFVVRTPRARQAEVLERILAEGRGSVRDVNAGHG